MSVKVYFTNIKENIIQNLRSAKKSIKVAVAWITDEDIIRILTQKVESGLDVQIIMSESKENFRNTSKYKDFLRLGGKLYISSPRFLHHKFCIIDSEIILNGSYNWTYFAQRNEENMLVIILDLNIGDDEKLLRSFEAKYNFLCNKISTPITNILELNNFKEKAITASIILTQIDEDEIALREELENDVKRSFEDATRIGIPISTLLLERMKTDGGGVEFIRRILNDEMSSGDMKSGFRKLEDYIPYRIDLSLEYLVSRPKYHKLFSNQEVEFCKRLMKKYNL